MTTAMSMRKFLTFALALCTAAIVSYAQDDIYKATEEATEALLQAPETTESASKPKYWTNSLSLELSLSQTSLTNWAAGGYNSLTLNSGIDAKAKYAKEQLTWNNRLQLQYGFLWTADMKNLLQKSNDLIYLESQFAYRTSTDSKWNYTISYDFRSQFTDSYDSYVQDEDTGKWTGTLQSGLFSPAYTNLAIGMQWVPADWFSINIAPLTGGFTVCTIPELRSSYGMKLRSDDLDSSDGNNYRSALLQIGAQIKVDFEFSINDVFFYETQLVLFTDYLSHPFRDNRVNWDNKISWSFSKYFKIALNTWLIYDPIVLIDDTQKVQFKEYFSISFTYLIASK